MVDTKHNADKRAADGSDDFEKEHSHRRNQLRDLDNLSDTGKGSGLDTLAEEQQQQGRKRKLRSDEVKHH